MSDSFRVWKNDYKQTDKHPDYKAANVEINGVECDVAVWMSETKNGDPCLSVVVSPPYRSKEERDRSKEDRAASKPVAAPPPPPDDDSLPF